MSRRLEELDSLRGLAALTVVVHHYFYVLPLFNDVTIDQQSLWLVNLIKYTPLHVFWSGYEAVILFFVLSGFVLSLPFYAGKQSSYLAFIIKRFCRIYLPYYAALAVAILLRENLANGPVSGLSAWFNGAWQQPLDPSLVLNHLALIGNFDAGQIDPVLWSLLVEMRVSLVFPFVMLLIRRYDWKVNLGIAFGLATISPITYALHLPIDTFNTAGYLAMFIVGALLAKHRVELVAYAKRLRRGQKYSLAFLALLAYTAKSWLFNYAILPDISTVSNFMIAFGIAVAIVLGLTTRASRFLTRPSVKYVGAISYSIYLYHAIVILALVNLFYPRVPVHLLWPAGLAITFALAAASYALVEMPAIRLGKRWSQLPTLAPQAGSTLDIDTSNA